MLLTLGVDPTLLIAYSRPRSASFTKKGPGRRRRLGAATRQFLNGFKAHDRATTLRLNDRFLGDRE